MVLMEQQNNATHKEQSSKTHGTVKKASALLPNMQIQLASLIGVRIWIIITTQRILISPVDDDDDSQFNFFGNPDHLKSE